MSGSCLAFTSARRLVLVGLVLAVLGLISTKADAAFPGVNGKIATSGCENSSDCSVEWFIWSLNPDGSGAGRLFSVPGFLDDDPAYSADGRWIAFQHCVPAGTFTFNCGIAIVDAHGQNLKQLTPSDGTNRDDYPAFSPDGTQIAFDRENDVWIMGVDGSNPHALTTGGTGARPEFSPDGTKIVFDRSGVLTLMTPSGGSPTAIPGSAGSDFSPNFSPDGTQVAFEDCTATPCRISVTRLDGSGRHTVTSPAASEHDDEPAFSPDGSTIVFERTQSGGQFPLFTVDPSGSGTPKQLTTMNDFKSSWGRIPTPSVDSPPTIGGLPARVGHTLTVSAGTANWGGATSFQWLSCDAQGANCNPISGETGTNFKPTNAAKGKTLKVRQTQSDAGGSASGDSAITGKVPGEPGAKIAHTGKVSSNGVARITVTCPAAQSGFCKGKLTLVGSVSSAKRLGTGSFRIAAGTHRPVKVKLSKRARAELARKGKLKVTATAKSRDDAGNATTTKAKVKLKRT